MLTEPNISYVGTAATIAERAGGKLPGTELKYAAILASVPWPLIATDQAGKVVVWNRAAERLLGFDEKFATGKVLSDLVRDPGCLDRDANAGDGKYVEKVRTWVGADGTAIRLDVGFGPTTEPAPGNDTQPGYLVNARVLSDNSQHGEPSQAADTLSDETFGKSLLEAQSIAGIGSWAFDARSGKVYWSDATFRLYGLDPEQGEPDFETLIRRKHPDDRETFRNLVFDAIRLGREYNVDNRIVRPDGSICYVHTVGKPFRDSKGDVVGLVGTALDITDRKLAEIALHDSEVRFRTAFEHSVIGMAMTAIADGRFLQVNSALCGITGYDQAELLNMSFRTITHPSDLAANLSFAAEVLRDDVKNHHFEKRFIRKTGDSVWVRVSVGVMRNPTGAPEHFITLIEDISARKLAEERWQLALEGVNDGVFDWDPRNNAIFYSARWKEMLGHSDQDLPNEINEWESRVHPEDFPSVQASLRRHLDGHTDHYVSEYRIRCKDGAYKWVMAKAKAVRDENGKPVRMIGAHSDISARKLAEEHLKFRAEHDQLTGVSNRGHFLEKFQLKVAAARNGSGHCYLCCCDIDHFKSVNDRYGHHTGDGVLIYFSSLLKECGISGTCVGRLGGDEFQVLITDATVDEAVRAMEAVRQRLANKKFPSKRGPFHVTASFGLAELQPHMDADDLQESADLALYRAKDLGRNRLHTAPGNAAPGSLAQPPMEFDAEIIISV